MQPYAQQNPDQNGEMMDIEDLNRLGRVRGPCPFYLSREMAATANIIFMPYNYLVDGKIRGGLQTKWENAVLIFDEAHNIEVCCSEPLQLYFCRSVDAPAMHRSMGLIWQPVWCFRSCMKRCPNI